MYQCLGHLGKGHITGDPVGVWSGDSGLLRLLHILVQATGRVPQKM